MDSFVSFVYHEIAARIRLTRQAPLVMFPYSYSCSEFPGDAETLMEAALGVAKSMKDVHGTAYKAGQACDLVYRAAGDSIDYAYGGQKIRWAYSAEMRDTGTVSRHVDLQCLLLHVLTVASLRSTGSFYRHAKSAPPPRSSRPVCSTSPSSFARPSLVREDDRQ
jgi:hypothetical protein